MTTNLTSSEKLQKLVCAECQGKVWKVKGQCAHPQLKNLQCPSEKEATP